MILTVPEAAERARCHPETITEAARGAELHGYQRAKHAKWRFDPECVDAWARGERCLHQELKAAA